jgi:hypothetical protein
MTVVGEDSGTVPDCRCEECRRRGELEALRACIRVRTEERDALARARATDRPLIALLGKQRDAALADADALQLAYNRLVESDRGKAELIEQMAGDLPPTEIVETEYDDRNRPTKVTTRYA